MGTIKKLAVQVIPV